MRSMIWGDPSVPAVGARVVCRLPRALGDRTMSLYGVPLTNRSLSACSCRPGVVNCLEAGSPFREPIVRTGGSMEFPATAGVEPWRRILL